MLSSIIAQLEGLMAQIKASGPVADPGAHLDISTHSKTGYEYARLRNGSVLSACGRVGSEKYLEVLSSIQRRDKISHLMQAISSLKQADEIPVVVPEAREAGVVALTAEAIASTTLESAPASKSNSKSASSARKNKGKGHKQLYTHVKTKQGSIVHAVLGKDKIGEWRTPALCGATPPQRDSFGWEYPTKDDGVTCTKCYRKLPVNAKQHIPSFE
ncbi:hypothetical protein [Acaryochloris sp. CCMEE 5410]|uniref:hypothetical protein n=1 Tax=Acaryochloris sp. CCMEE 5410 TaxID=310037 RepID=UPI0002483FDB|nr:hypothetical protein [Acaryochloris sp. CCMEE 5410]KAI9129360.1 hypothetical protein ON05_035135 [Acaryochloris sp. CCMEE 5410]